MFANSVHFDFSVQHWINLRLGALFYRLAMLFKNGTQNGYPRRPSLRHQPYRRGTFTSPSGRIVFHVGCCYICRLEADADYIGIMLLAAAGFDPHAALKVREKFADIERNKDYGWRYDDRYSTHPPEEKRAQLLSQSKVMGEALHLYREVTANQGQEKVSPECGVLSLA